MCVCVCPCVCTCMRARVCVCVGWKGCQAASPGSARVSPGCPSRLACPNLGPGELVLPPRVAKGSRKRQINGQCLVPYPEGSRAPGEGKRSFICLLSLFYHFFSAAATRPGRLKEARQVLRFLRTLGRKGRGQGQRKRSHEGPDGIQVSCASGGPQGRTGVGRTAFCSHTDQNSVQLFLSSALCSCGESYNPLGFGFLIQKIQKRPPVRRLGVKSWRTRS